MNALKEKIGPFPLWAWLVGLSVLGLVYYLYERHKEQTQAAAAAAAATKTSEKQQTRAVEYVPSRYGPERRYYYPSPRPVEASQRGRSSGSEAPDGYTQISYWEAIDAKKIGGQLYAKNDKGELLEANRLVRGNVYFVSQQWLAGHMKQLHAMVAKTAKGKRTAGLPAAGNGSGGFGHPSTTQAA